jgi:DNA-directed RNA polymerase specialized sigma subunit
MARSASKFQLNEEQQKLVEDNLNLARREAWRYQRRTDMEYRTLESVAFEGLCQAAYKYDPERINEHTGKPMKFSSIAVPYTRGAILHYIRDKTYLLRLSHKMRETWLKGRKLMQQGHNDISVCSILNIEMMEWLETKAVCSGPPLELKEHGAPTVEPTIHEDDNSDYYLEKAQQLLDSLTETDRARITAYFNKGASPVPTKLLTQLGLT